jgi:hypothetical protein
MAVEQLAEVGLAKPAALTLTQTTSGTTGERPSLVER